MNASNDDLVQRFRSSDPANAVQVTDVEARAAANSLVDPVMQKPDRLGRSTLRLGRWRCDIRIVTGLGAAVLVAGLAVGAALLRGSGSGSHVTTGGQRHKAEAVVSRLVASLPLPSDVLVQRHAPSGELQSPPSQPIGNQYVTATRWYTATERPSELLKFVRENTHLVYAGSGSRGRGSETVQDLRFSAPTTDPWIAQAQVLVTVVRHGSGSAIRVDAQALWLAKQRGPLLPTNLPVDVAVERVSQPPVSARLTGDSARQIIAHVNELPLAPDVASGCGRDVLGDRDSLLIRTGKGNVTVSFEVGGCPWVRKTEADGGVEHLYDPDQTSNRVILGLLGLPADYGAH